VGRIC